MHTIPFSQSITRAEGCLLSRIRFFSMSAQNLSWILAMKQPPFAPFVALIAVLVAAGQAQATDYTWTGSTSGNWSNSMNWSSAPVFNADSGIVFNSSSANLTNFIDVDRTVGAISFDQLASGVSIRLDNGSSTGRTLTLGNATVAPTITVVGNSTVTHTIGSTSNGGVALGGNLTVNVDSATLDATILTIARPVSGGFGITKEGTGLLYLNATNTYTGKTVVNGGRVRIANTGSLGANPGSFVADQVTLNSGSLYLPSSGSLGNRGITLGAGGGGFIANNGASFTIDASIAGTGNLTQQGFSQGFTLTLSANNTFSGATSINSPGSATMVLTAINALQNSAIDTTNTVTGNATAGFRLNYGANTNLNIGGLIGNKDLSTIFRTDGNYGTVTTITLNTVDGKDLSYSGAITGARSLVKTGNGTQTFTGALSYTGTTNVSAGTLVMNGSYTGNGSISVASGATLSGNGTIVGATTIAGSLSPGNSPGLLTFNGSLALEDTTITTMEINGTSRGSTFDAVDVVGAPGALTYNGTMNLVIGTTFSAGNYTFDLFDFVSHSNSFDFVSLTGNYTGALTNNAGIWTTTTNSGAESWTFTQSTGVLNLVVVPEPSTLALAMFGVAGIGYVARRRLKRGE
jgi:autotransporter-associated beta strand protein